MHCEYQIYRQSASCASSLAHLPWLLFILSVEMLEFEVGRETMEQQQCPQVGSLMASATMIMYHAMSSQPSVLSRSLVCLDICYSNMCVLRY
jgi:hypothetical protein